MNKEEWEPDIRRASYDEDWVMVELQKRTSGLWRWIKNPQNVGADLLCVKNLLDAIKPLAEVEVEGTPKYRGREDTWPAGYEYPPKWRRGLTMPSRKFEDYIQPRLKQNCDAKLYYLKCNHTHSEAFVIPGSAFLLGTKLNVPYEATPERMRKHDLVRRDIMIAVKPDCAQYGIPHVFDWIIKEVTETPITKVKV